jgi:hypothetical protein
VAERSALPRLPLLALGMASLLVGLYGGVARTGVALPGGFAAPIALHGPLMVSGFLGTVIGLERAVALGRPWGYAGPAASGLGAALLLALGTDSPTPWLFVAAAGVLVAILAIAHRRAPSAASRTIALGAAMWLAGNAWWASGRAVSEAVPLWIAFLALTIAGERLELTRFLAPSRRARIAFAAAAGATLAGALVTPWLPGAGTRLLGASSLALAAWLGANDIARKNLRREGLPRFTAVCLLSGYVWLALSGAFALAHGAVSAGPRYDAWLHAFFLGFVMAMIFGHAPIIFPAILRRPVPFQGAFYAHLLLLHATLFVRVVGDLTGWAPAVRWGGLGNGVALIAFLANTVSAVVIGARKRA